MLKGRADDGVSRTRVQQQRSYREVRMLRRRQETQSEGARGTSEGVRRNEVHHETFAIHAQGECPDTRDSDVRAGSIPAKVKRPTDRHERIGRENIGDDVSHSAGDRVVYPVRWRIGAKWERCDKRMRHQCRSEIRASRVGLRGYERGSRRQHGRRIPVDITALVAPQAFALQE